MKTPQQFIDLYNGKSIDDDGAYGVQCVDGYRVFCKWIGLGAYPTGTGWADGYWQLRYDNPKVVQTFDFIEDASLLQKGDWCFWGHGSSCPDSHVAMFVEYAEPGYAYFFGENQGNFKGFQTVKIRTDILGAFRWKEWSNMNTKLVNGLQTISYKNSTYHVYKGYYDMQLYMLSAVGGDHALQDITAYDDDNLIIYAMGNCNYFQMNADDYGQHYGVEQSNGDGIHSQSNDYAPKNPAYISYYELPNGEDNYMLADNYMLSKRQVQFACSPYSVRFHNGVEVNDISSAFTNKEQYATNQTAYFKLKTGEWCIAVSEGKILPQTMVNAMKSVADIQEMFLVDSGGSSQLWAWNKTKGRMEKALYTGRPLPNVLCLATPKDNTLPSIPDDPEPITPTPTPDTPTQPDTPSVPDTPSEPDDDGKINWKRKLSSRKFWMAIAAAIVSMAAAFGYESESTQITALIMGVGTIVAYILSEGWVDASRASSKGNSEE